MKKATNIEGREIFFSASSADGFQACPRRWWFAKVMGFQEPKDASLSFGTAVHLVLENYLRDGTTIAPGEHNDGREVVEVVQEHIDRAKAGLDLLPKPGTYLVENWLPRVKILDTDDGVMSVVGKIDMYLPNTGRHGNPYHTGGWPEDVTGHVLDHKTSSDPKRWMPTADKLASNAQGLLYAAALQKAEVLEPGDVLFTHHYVAKKGLPKSYIVHTRMKHENIEEHWDRQQGVAQEMVNIASSVRNVAQQGEVRANLSACRSYGRLCPFADACQAQKPKGVFAAIDAFDAARNGQTTQEEPPMSGGLFSKLKAREATPPTAPTTPPKSADTTKNSAVKPVTQIVPPDAAPMAVESVSAEMLRDAASVLQTCNKPTDPLTLSECVEILVSELVPEEYRYCVIAAVDPDALSGTPYADLSKIDASRLLSGFPNTQDALLATGATATGATATATATIKAEKHVPTEDEISARAVLSIHNERGFRSIVERASIAALKIALETPARRDGAPFDWQLKVIREVLDGTEKVEGPRDEVFHVVWHEDDPRYTATGRAVLLRLRGGATCSAADVLELMRKSGFARPHRKTADKIYMNVLEIPGIEERGGCLVAPSSAALAEAAVEEPLPPEPVIEDVKPVAAAKPAPAPAPVVEAPKPVAKPAPVQVKTTNTPEISDMTLILVQAAIQGAGVEPTMLREMEAVQQAISRVAQRIKAENNMPWELFNNYGDSGPKRVVIELQSVLTRDGLPKGVYYVERTDPLVGADMLTVLRQAGAVVVRGAV